MDFGVLGPLRVETRGGSAVSARLQRRLLGLLLMRTNTTVPIEELVEALWPDEPLSEAKGGQRLHLLVHRLRTSLGDASRIGAGQGGYRLVVLPGELDLDRFETLRREGADAVRAGEHERGATVLRAAVELWRGEPYEGLGPAFDDERERLEGLRLSVLDDLYTADLKRGGQPPVDELTSLASEHPLRERFQALLVVALYDAGKPAAAVEAYLAAKARLVDGLGLDPGPELRRVGEAVVAGRRPSLTAAAPPRVLVPAQLPADVSGFAGRVDQLAALDRLLEAGASSAVLSGIAGVGKTALAVHWAHRVRQQFPDGQLYVDLRGFSPGPAATPADVLLGMLRALGVPPDLIPKLEAERSTLFWSLLADRRVLVVLDNAGDVGQAQPLIADVPGAFTLVTSRVDLGGLSATRNVSRLTVSPLSQAEARQVVVDVLGDAVDREPAAADALIASCAGLPLALRIAVANIHTGEGSPIERLVDDLDSGDRLAGLEVIDDPDASVRNAFQMSYDALDEQGRRAFRYAGLVPGADFTIELLASACGLPESDVERAARTLRGAHLFDHREPAHLGMHDLVRLYAAERADAEESQSAIDQAIDSMFHHYLARLEQVGRTLWLDVWFVDQAAPGGAAVALDPQAARAWLEREHDNVLALVRAHPSDRQAWRVVHGLRYELDARGDDAGWVALNDLALASARAHGDLAGEAHLLYDTVIATMRSDLMAATRVAERSIAVAQQSGEEYVEGLAWGGLAGVQHYRGDLTAAIDSREKSRRCFANAGYESGVQRNLGYLAECYLDMGDLEAARRFAQQAYDIAVQNNWRRTQHGDLSVLADIDLLEGKYADALAHADLGRTVAAELGDGPAEAYQRMTCGRALTGLGRFAEARASLVAAREDLIRLDWKRAQVEVLEALADLADAQGDQGVSTGLLELALSLARSTSHAQHATRIATRLGRT